MGTNNEWVLRLLKLAAHALETPGDFTPEEMDDAKSEIGCYLAELESSGEGGGEILLPQNMRVNTCAGLQPISLFDEVEVHPMMDDENGDGSLVPSEDGFVDAFSVFLHLRGGGIECVQDFCFDSSEPGAADRAKGEAAMLGEQLYDMLRVSGMLRSMRQGGEDNRCGILVSLDGGLSYQDARDGVRIVYPNLLLAGEDGPGELHINATEEGLIMDAWVSREEPLDHNIGTSSETATEIADRLIESAE